MASVPETSNHQVGRLGINQVFAPGPIIPDDDTNPELAQDSQRKKLSDKMGANFQEYITSPGRELSPDSMMMLLQQQVTLNSFIQ